VRKEVDILRVARGSQHAAKVGGKSLKHNDGENEPYLSRCTQNRDGKGDKGQKGNIVAYQHA
jgi:hypothetical protein